MMKICLLNFTIFFILALVVGLPLDWCIGIALFAFLVSIGALSCLRSGEIEPRMKQ